MLHHPAFSQIGQQCMSTDGYSPELHPDQEFSQIDMQGEVDYSSYSWDNNSIWHDQSAMLMNGDFDINSIPSIELGEVFPKYGTQEIEPSYSQEPFIDFPSEYGQEYSQAHYDASQGVDRSMNFDEMISGQSF
ncbi:hypothetical protein MPER_14230 [Moniliophthora perniciosa FA553]|nr:hypothetical protein MPER_14230 [Moniliophthora perniciosa FA553]